MHSIFLNKTTSRLLFLCIFIRCICLGQGVIEKETRSTILALDPISEQERVSIEGKKNVKKFIGTFVKTYDHNLSKLERKSSKFIKFIKFKFKEDQSILDPEMHIHIDSGNVEHEYSLECNYTDAKFTLSSKYEGTKGDLNHYPEENLKKITKNYHKIIPAEDDKTLGLLNEKEFVFELNPQFKSRKAAKYIPRYYNRRWRYKNKPHSLTFGANVSANISTLYLNPKDFSTETEIAFQERLSNEQILDTFAIGFTLGYTKYSNSISLTYRHSHYGVNFDTPSSIDWETGYYNQNALDVKDQLKIKTHQIGIQYRRSDYFKVASLYFVGGINYVWMTEGTTHIPNDNSRFFGVNINLGLGLNIKPSYCWEMHLAPITNIFVTGISGEKINNRFTSGGLEFGVTYHIPCFNW